MNETEFCYWLQGFFELSNSNMLSSKQVQQIKDHLDLVFTKVTPDRNTKNKNSKNKLKEEPKLTLANLDFDSPLPIEGMKKYCANMNELGSRKIC